MGEFHKASVKPVAQHSRGKTREERLLCHSCLTSKAFNSKKVPKSRNVSANHIVKIGVDGGKGFLKICLAILELDSADDSSQSPPQKRFLTQRIAKDSGVKRQILAAVAEDLPENYVNVKQLWSLVDANSIKYFIATDMKLANILFGL